MVPLAKGPKRDVQITAGSLNIHSKAIDSMADIGYFAPSHWNGWS
jgi:hypothetical protein